MWGACPASGHRFKPPETLVRKAQPWQLLAATPEPQPAAAGAKGTVYATHTWPPKAPPAALYAQVPQGPCGLQASPHSQPLAPPAQLAENHQEGSSEPSWAPLGWPLGKKKGDGTKWEHQGQERPPERLNHHPPPRTCVQALRGQGPSLPQRAPQPALFTSLPHHGDSGDANREGRYKASAHKQPVRILAGGKVPQRPCTPCFLFPTAHCIRLLTR